MMPKLTYRYWDEKSGKKKWRYGRQILPTIEDCEEFLCNTDLDIDKADVDGKPVQLTM